MARKILIIEDNSINRALFRTILQTHGYDTLEANNGADGVKAAREHRPQVILTDLQMPAMDGFEAARLLREGSETRGIPLIAVTAFATEADREKVMASGFDGYICKSHIFTELPKLLRRFLPPENNE